MSEATPLKPVAILGGKRIPFCRNNTHYAEIGNREMAIQTLASLVAAHGLEDQQLGEVAFGSVIKHSRDWNLAREALLSSGLSPYTPGITIQRACGTSLDAAIIIGNKIATGQIDAGIAGGSDTTSDVPIVYKDRFAKRLLKMARSKGMMNKLRAFSGFRPSDLAPSFPGVAEPRTGKSMGQHCEMMAREWDIDRASQDQLACESHHKAAESFDAGFHDSLVTPFRGIARDTILRPDTSIEKLSTLKPAFDRKSGHGTLTAGNSTPLTDGASCALLSSDEWARKNKQEVLAYMTHARVAAFDFEAGDGLLMAPTQAVADLLKATGLTLQDFDYYEIHEAFAAQVLCTLKAWESSQYCKQKLGMKKAMGSIDRSRLNVVGSSLAVGHPFAATGTRILSVMGKLLAEKGSGRGLISICTAGGMGVAAIVERP